MAEDVFTLPEILSSSGYEIFCNTAVVTSLAPLHGRFPDANRNMHAKAKTMVDDCIDWWKSTAGPKFGYLHLGDLHGLGSNPRVYPTDGKYPFGVCNESTILSGEPDEKSYATTYERMYDTNLRYVDSHLERLYESIIRSSGETVVVVVGDHGQTMREHTVEKQEWFEYPYEMSGYGHGSDLFQESINVPLYISDIDDINTSQPIVSTIDIVPTVLDILDAQIDIPMDGESLLKTLQDDRKIISQEVSVGFEQIAVVTEDRKLYFSPKNNILKMIRLGENTEAVIQSPTVDDNELQQSLFEMIPNQKISGERMNLDKKTQSQLKELGYI
jgi:membrane-anchored protein YejM (alkaline phosphatase superfamily)